MTLIKTGLFAIALALAACASTGQSGAGTGTTPSAGEAANPAATAIAAKLGVSEKYVTMALQAAQGALGSQAQPTPEAKDAAAKQGVDKAAAQAQTDGTPLSDDQKSGLLDGLKGIL